MNCPIVRLLTTGGLVKGWTEMLWVETETSCKGGCLGCLGDINPSCPFPHPGGSFIEARRQPIIHSALSDNSFEVGEGKGKPGWGRLSHFTSSVAAGRTSLMEPSRTGRRYLQISGRWWCWCRNTFTNGGSGSTGSRGLGRFKWALLAVHVHVVMGFAKLSVEQNTDTNKLKVSCGDLTTSSMS